MFFLAYLNFLCTAMYIILLWSYVLAYNIIITLMYPVFKQTTHLYWISEVLLYNIASGINFADSAIT